MVGDRGCYFLALFHPQWVHPIVRRASMLTNSTSRHSGQLPQKNRLAKQTMAYTETFDHASVASAPSVTPTKKHLRRVRFQEAKSEATDDASLTSLDDDERDLLWYRDTEIERFRTDARLLCRALRRRSLQPGESLRGLEYRKDIRRQERKQMTIRCIVKAQHRASNPRQLANIYRKCSKWSIMVASAVADNDFYAAYDLGFSCQIPVMAEHPLPFRSKSSGSSKRTSCASASGHCDSVIASNHSQSHRRVRQRTEAVV